MSILTVLQEAATVIGLAVPSTVFGSTEREHVELAALANEMGKRIAHDTHDWTVLKTLATLTGDGSATTFSRPTDYQRMLKKAKLWPSATPYTPLQHVPDSDEWLGYDVQNFTAIIGRWTLLGSDILIKPAVANTKTVKFYYISTKIVTAADTTTKTIFDTDTDVYRLNERTLRLAMVWQWLAQKGRPYSEAMETFETALANDIGADKGSRMITIGQVRMPGDARVAFPGIIVG